jgi:Outer membrane protein beta-barrel domain
VSALPPARTPDVTPRHKPRLRPWRVVGRRLARAGALLSALLLGALLLAPAQAQARPEDQPWELGFGLAGSRIKGGLDGRTEVIGDPTAGPNSYLAKPDRGGGALLQVGRIVNPHFAIEGLLLSTRHDSTHESFPGRNFNVRIVSLLGSARFMLPLGERSELFGRVGLGPFSVRYEDNAQVPSSTLQFGTTLTGMSFAVGGGFAMFFDRIGFEVALLHERARLTDLTAAEHVVDSFNHVYVSRGTFAVSVLMAFGGGS